MVTAIMNRVASERSVLNNNTFSQTGARIALPVATLTVRLIR